MGKIVKYCSSCDEGFGERFTFCPDCGSSLQAFEMNPVTGNSAPVEEPAPTKPAFVAESPVETEAPANFQEVTETPVEPEVEEAPAIQAAAVEEDRLPTDRR